MPDTPTDTPTDAPPDIASALAENAMARAGLMEAIDALPAARRAEPAFDGWSIQDIVLHIAIWQEAGAGALTQFTAGERPTIEGYDGDNTDEWNAARVAEARGGSWEQALARLRAAREAFEAAARVAAESVTAERLAENRTVERVSDLGGDHDQEHTEQILVWRREHGI